MEVINYETKMEQVLVNSWKKKENEATYTTLVIGSQFHEQDIVIQERCVAVREVARSVTSGTNIIGNLLVKAGGAFVVNSSDSTAAIVTNRP